MGYFLHNRELTLEYLSTMTIIIATGKRMGFIKIGKWEIVVRSDTDRIFLSVAKDRLKDNFVFIGLNSVISGLFLLHILIMKYMIMYMYMLIVI